MDTPLELARDEWWQANLYSCETCTFSRRTKSGKYYCDYSDSDNYGTYSEDIYGCDDWIEGSMV